MNKVVYKCEAPAVGRRTTKELVDAYPTVSAFVGEIAGGMSGLFLVFRGRVQHISEQPYDYYWLRDENVSFIVDRFVDVDFVVKEKDHE